MRKKTDIKNYQKGFSLIELMVSLVLGLLIALALGSIFLASNKTIKSAEALSKIQENSRIAFEMMGRDIRKAGGNPCTSNAEIGSTLNSLNTSWWQDWRGGMRGYLATNPTAGTNFGGSVGNRVAGTQALDLFSASDSAVNIVNKMTSGAANIVVDNTSTLKAGDIALACDTNVAFVFQISSAGSGGTNLQRNSGSGAPGNCARPFSYNDTCNNAATGYLFENDGMVAKVEAMRWYIGTNEEGGKSLFKSEMINTGMSDTPTILKTIEIARDVEDMVITYFIKNGIDYIQAGAVIDWSEVVSVKIKLSMSSVMVGQVDAGMDEGQGNEMKRDLTQIVYLRNR